MVVSVDESKIRPLGDNLLVEALEEDTTLDNGIVIPDNVKQFGVQFLVVACGPRVSEDVRVGDHIMVDWDLEEGTVQLIPDPTNPSREFFVLPESAVVGVFD